MSTKYYLGLDIGGTYCKAIIIDNYQNIDSIVIRPTPGFLSNKKGIKEICPREIEKVVIQLIREVVSHKKNIINAVGITGQMHGTLLIDDSGKPKSNFITWQDQRVKNFFKSDETYLSFFSKELPNFHNQSGSSLRSGMMGPLLFWMTQNTPEILKKTHCTVLPDYVASLFSDSFPISNPTQAAATGIYDVKNDCWIAEYIKYLDLSEKILPKLTTIGCTSGFVSTPFSKKTGLKRGIPVFSSIGDYQAALYGSGLKINDISINIGTGGQVSHLIKDILIYPGIETRPFLDDKYTLCIPGINAGRSIAVMNNFFRSIFEVFDSEKKINFKVIEDKILYSKELPIPIVNANFFKRNGGGIFNITPENFSAERLYFSLLKNLAQNYHLAHKKIRSVTGKNNFNRLMFSGGVIRKSYLLQYLIKNEFTINNAILSSFEEEAASGVALLARKWQIGMEEN
jgi:sugar (pentulose or hexulose) kinase